MLSVDIIYFEDLAEDEQGWQPDNGRGKEYKPQEVEVSEYYDWKK